MNKVLIEVDVPIIEKKYDIFVPINKKVGRLIIQINEIINDITNGVYIIKNNSVLYNKANGSVLKQDVLVKDSGLKNGSKVILI